MPPPASAVIFGFSTSCFSSSALTARSMLGDRGPPFGRLERRPFALLLLLLLLLPAGDGVRLGALLFLRGGICDARTKTRKAGVRVWVKMRCSKCSWLHHFFTKFVIWFATSMRYCEGGLRAQRQQ